MYYVNTYDLPSRPLYTIKATTLHEAVPGHHLQLALQQELQGLPDFRKVSFIFFPILFPFSICLFCGSFVVRVCAFVTSSRVAIISLFLGKNGGWTAYIEGWALYSESLGIEMGYYPDHYYHFGRLGNEMFRACRLVITSLSQHILNNT